jgi:hypothetical protein
VKWLQQGEAVNLTVKVINIPVRLQREVDGEGKYKTQVKHNKNTTANDKQRKERVIQKK